MALLPTIGVAVFATFTVNMGLEAWFSDRVQSVIGASRSAAEAYETEQREAIIEDITQLALNWGFFAKGNIERIFLSLEISCRSCSRKCSADCKKPS
jgi:two-component system nitrogen regulation sensor histidine kinase NtrY